MTETPATLGLEKPEGAPTFWQVIPDNGYILHAVRAEFFNGAHRQRFGLWGNLVGGPTACRKVRGKDSQGYPSLRLLFSAEEEARVRNLSESELAAIPAGAYEVDKVARLRLRVPREFTRKWEDFDESLWKSLEDKTGGKRICGDCATAVLRAWQESQEHPA